MYWLMEEDLSTRHYIADSDIVVDAFDQLQLERKIQTCIF